MEYPPDFYARLSEGCLQAAHAILPILWKSGSFLSVVDVGCGTGAWLHVAQKLGAQTIVGVEGSEIPADLLLVSPESLVIAEMEEPLSLKGRFDLCLCLEVAEHLSEARASSFVRELTSLADVILFSAAIPFQGGVNHINEQWPEYWAHLFAAAGFDVWAGLRPNIWRNVSIPWWYRQNLMLFAKNSIWKARFPDIVPDDPANLSVIHPECYLWRSRSEKRTDVFKSLVEGWSF